MQLNEDKITEKNYKNVGMIYVPNLLIITYFGSIIFIVVIS